MRKSAASRKAAGIAQLPRGAGSRPPFSELALQQLPTWSQLAFDSRHKLLLANRSCAKLPSQQSLAVDVLNPLDVSL